MPFIGSFFSDGYFGKDGFGDFEFDKKILGKVDRSKHASIALVELAKKHEGNISIVQLAPLTNIAIAASLDTNFLRRVKKFYMMGTSVAGVGLLRPNVDFNVGLDPESSFILLNSTTSSQLTLLPWETVVNTYIPKEWRTYELGKYDSPYVDFMNKIERISLGRNETYYQSADSITVATLLWPEIIKNVLETNVQMVIDGSARGSVLVDYKRELRPFNAKIIRSVDPGLLRESLIYYLTCEKVAC